MISKRLTELMGGTTWVESTVGKGSTFCFTMLLSWADEAPSESPRPLGPLAKSTVFRATTPPQGERCMQGLRQSLYTQGSRDVVHCTPNAGVTVCVYFGQMEHFSNMAYASDSKHSQVPSSTPACGARMATPMQLTLAAGACY